MPRKPDDQLSPAELKRRLAQREYARNRYRNDAEFRGRKLEYARNRYSDDAEFRERLREYQRERYHNDPEHREYFRQYQKARYQNDRAYREHLREYVREYRRAERKRACAVPGSDAHVIHIMTRVAHNQVLRARAAGLLQREDCRGTDVEMLLDGGTWEDVRLHIERQWILPAESDERWMRWGSYGRNSGCWGIDHQVGFSKWESLKPHAAQRRMFSYKNLRPLWMEDNIRDEHNKREIGGFRWIEIANFPAEPKGQTA